MQAPHHFLAPSGHPGALDKPQLERFWDLETIGINDWPHQSDDHAASTLFHESVRHVDGRYEVGWPWQPGYELPNNYQLAKGRLATFLHRLRCQPDLLRPYDHVLQQQLSSGIVEVVSPPATNLSHRLHYLPHHPVLSPGSATTKLRIVYDGSAKIHGSNYSLNECLYRGPVLLQDLAGILLRFRLHRIAVTADIEKAFLQVGLRTDDRDVTHFLWLKDVITPGASENNIQEL